MATRILAPLGGTFVVAESGNGMRPFYRQGTIASTDAAIGRKKVES
jgi:hypothetical protein